MIKFHNSVWNLLNKSVDTSVCGTVHWSVYTLVKASIYNPVKSSIGNSIKDCVRKEYNKKSSARN